MWFHDSVQSWKKRVNETLTHAIGYKIVRAKTQNSVRWSDPAKVAAKKAAAPGGKAPAKKAPAKPKAEFPVDYDEDFCATIRAAREYTMTSNDKLHALISATKYIQRYNIPGAVVECGVWRGGRMHAVARTL